MNVRRRNIDNRLGRDLQLERGSHEVTRGLLRVTQDIVRRALDERDEVRRQLQRHRDLASELGRYFTDPPGVLSRDSDLFLLLQECQPRSVPPLPPTPEEVLQTVLSMAGVTMAEALEVVRGAQGKSGDDRG